MVLPSFHRRAAGASTDDPLAAVQALLDRRAAAVRSGDRSEFLATVDPRAAAEFRQAQNRLFDGLRSLPLERYELHARTDDTGDLSRGLTAGYGGLPVFLPETRQVMRLQGYDDRDAVDSLWLTYVERDGRWFVAGDDDLAAVGLDTARGLWDGGAVRAARTAHFLVLSHPEDAARADALGATAEEALAVLHQRSTFAWSERMPIVLPSSTDELGALIQSTIDLDKYVAFVLYGALRDDGYRPTAPRMYIQDANLRRYPPRFQLETLTHELTHAAASSSSGPAIPAWVQEGVADWVATGRSTSERAPRRADHLPRDFEFTTGTSASIVRAYAASRSAMSALSAHSGLAAPEALLQAIGRHRIEPGDEDHWTDEALRAGTALDTPEFVRFWIGRREGSH